MQVVDSDSLSLIRGSPVVTGSRRMGQGVARTAGDSALLVVLTPYSDLKDWNTIFPGLSEDDRNPRITIVDTICSEPI
jgi:small ligand-binding sensory domain FIST